MITQNQLKSLLTYYPDTGHFYWMRHPGGRAKLDQPAGWIGATGHRCMKVKNVETTAARYVWLYVYGHFPQQEIEHINLDPADCRLVNLRETVIRVPRPLTADRLKELLIYDHTSGLFKWKNHKKMRGKHAGHDRGDGYILMGVDGVTYRAHRLAWLYHYGQWPLHHLDHINGIPSDNRIKNLREATVAQNMANSKRPKTNKSGYKGVSWSTKAKKWQVHIRIDGASKFLGLFKNPQDGYAVYCMAAIKARGEFARNE